MVAASKPTSWLSVHSHILCHLASTEGPSLVVWAVSLSTTELIPRSLTPVLWNRGIRSLSDFGKLVGPLGQTVLYSHD